MFFCSSFVMRRRIITLHTRSIIVIMNDIYVFGKSTMAVKLKVFRPRGRRPKLDEQHRMALIQAAVQHPEASLADLKDWVLSSTGISLARSTVLAILNAEGVR